MPSPKLARRWGHRALGPSVASCVALAATGAALGGADSHWALDETRGAIAHDSAGGHHGTILGSPAFVPGVVGNAIRLSRATADRILVGNYYGTGAAFSVSLWIKLAPDAPIDNYAVGSHYAGV